MPDGVLFGSSKAHKELLRMIIEEQKLDAVISLPSGEMESSNLLTNKSSGLPSSKKGAIRSPTQFSFSVSPKKSFMIHSGKSSEKWRRKATDLRSNLW